MSATMLWGHGAEVLASNAAGALVAALWQGTLLVVVVALLLRVLPGLSAAVRGRLWLATLLALVLLPLADLLVPARAPGAGVGGAAAAMHVGQGWSVALLAAWTMLALVRGLQLAASAHRVRRMAREAQPVEPSAQLNLLLRGVELCVSADAVRPSVAGWRRPRILLPPAVWAEMAGAELRQVVLHELEHLRRGDQWTNLLQKAALVAMPLSPAAMWVERRLCLERELACDDGVLQRSTGRKAYAACLTRMAEHALAGSRLGREAVLALGAWSRQSELALRVTRLLHAPEQAVPAGRRRAAVVAVAGVVLLGGAGLTEVPRLVQFGPSPAVDISPATAAAEQLTAAPVATRPGTAAVGGQMVLAAAHISPERRAQAFRSFGDGSATDTAMAGQRTRKAAPTPLQGQPDRPTMRHAHPLQRPNLRQVVSVRRRQSPGGSWVVLTAADGAVTVRAVPAVAVVGLTSEEEISPSYAAVPVADGWLVVQL